jgi:hypothetical protein
MHLTDRIARAVELARGRRVLDIGGQKMPTCDAQPFARYAHIGAAAAENTAWRRPGRAHLDYVLDLNTRAGVDALARAIAYRPR